MAGACAPGREPCLGVKQQYRQTNPVKNLACELAEDEFPQTAMPVSTHYEKVGIEPVGAFQNCLRNCRCPQLLSSSD